MARTPIDFCPSDDTWLHHPLSADTVQRATDYWTQRQALEATWNTRCMVLMLALIVPGVVIMSATPVNSAGQMWGAGVVLVGTLVMLAGVLLTVRHSVSSRWRHSFEPLSLADQAKFDWLLDHTTSASALREHRQAYPRSAVQAELQALDRAHEQQVLV